MNEVARAAISCLTVVIRGTGEPNTRTEPLNPVTAKRQTRPPAANGLAGCHHITRFETVNSYPE